MKDRDHSEEKPDPITDTVGSTSHGFQE